MSDTENQHIPFPFLDFKEGVLTIDGAGAEITASHLKFGAQEFGRYLFEQFPTRDTKKVSIAIRFDDDVSRTDLSPRRGVEGGEPLATTAVEFPVLADGERYAGILLGAYPHPMRHVILLPGESKDLSRKDAMTWAAAVGGRLPTRHEQWLLLANLKEFFRDTCYWAIESNGSACLSHYTDFTHGRHGFDNAVVKFPARAIRTVSF